MYDMPFQQCVEVWGGAKRVTAQGSKGIGEVWAQSQIRFQWIMVSFKAAPRHIFMDRISRHSHGAGRGEFSGVKITTLLFADDVALMAPSACDLH